MWEGSGAVFIPCLFYVFSNNYDLNLIISELARILNAKGRLVKDRSRVVKLPSCLIPRDKQKRQKYYEAVIQENDNDEFHSCLKRSNHWIVFQVSVKS